MCNILAVFKRYGFFRFGQWFRMCTSLPLVSEFCPIFSSCPNLRLLTRFSKTVLKLKLCMFHFSTAFKMLNYVGIDIFIEVSKMETLRHWICIY